MRSLVRFIERLPSQLARTLIRLYQILLSPMFGNRCRFHPSCSQYALEAIDRFGVIRGTWFALGRLSRCHPFHPGGFDPVPAASASSEVQAHKEN